MAGLSIALVLLCASSLVITASADARVVTAANANPIRRIVNMLQGLTKKIKEEGDKEAQEQCKFKEYCSKNTEAITASISNNQANMPQLQSSLQESRSKIAQLQAEVKAAEEDRAAATAALESAATQRDAENKEYVAESDEYRAFVGTLSRAIPAIEKGTSSSFLQTQERATLRTALESSFALSEFQKHDVMAFLSGQGTEVGPSDIAGMLGAMKDEAEKNLADVDAVEAGQVKNHEDLMAAKTKQIKNLQEPIEEKKVRISELALAAANLGKNLAETETALSSDTKFAADLAKSCSDEAAITEKNAAARSEEMVAVQDTIKILNDDSALETFKKTLPSASLLQMETSSKRNGLHAVKVLRSFRSSDKASQWGKSDIDLLEVALKGGKGDFSRVTKMIDGMVSASKEQQATDEKKLKNCKQMSAASEAKLKKLTQKLEYLGAAADDRSEVLSSASAEVKEITQSIQNLDAAVKDATTQRQSENAEYKALTSANHAAIQLLRLAKDRMNEFYNPSKHPKTGFIVLPGWSGVKPHSRSFLQVSSTQVHQFWNAASKQVNQASSGVSTYKTKKQESNKVVTMLDHLIQDLNKEVTVAESEEKYEQIDYERVLEDSAGRRAENGRSLVEKESVMADAEDAILETKQSLKTEMAQNADAEKFASQLKSDCDWIVSNYEARTEARTSEISALRDTKATLAGASASFIQTGSLRGVSIGSL